MDLRAYLESKGVRVKGPGPNVRMLCFFHGEEPGKRGRLYVNIGDSEEQGLFKCFVCDAKGNLRTLMRHFGDDMEVLDDSLHARQMVLYDAAQFYEGKLHPKIAEWLRDERGLSNETIMERQIGWAPSEDGSGRNYSTALYRHLKTKGHKVDAILSTGLVVDRNGTLRDFLQACVTIPYHVNGNVVQIRGKSVEEGGKYLTPPGQSARLYNVDAIQDNEVVLLAEGEFDALVLGQFGFPCVGVPGAKTWQDSWTKSFEDCRRVHIIFDPDAPGTEGALKVREHLGPTARVVDLPVPIGVEPKEVDPSYLVVTQGWGQAEFEEVVARSLATSNLLISVDDAYEEWVALQGASGLKFGMEQLDWAIEPGLLPAQVMVVLAKTGTGKTISLLNIFQRMAMVKPDLKVLFVSLEQTRSDWFERARRIWNFYNPEVTYQKVNEGTLDFWRPKLEMTDRNRMSEADLVTSIEEYEARQGSPPDIVAIDYLGYWAAGFKGRDRYEKVSDAIMKLKAVAKDRRVAMIAPHQVNRMVDFGAEFDIDNARESGVVEETADFALTLWSPDSVKGKLMTERTGVMHMKIGKSRNGGKGVKIDLQFAPLTLTIVPIEEQQMVGWARDELKYDEKRERWEQAIWHHRTGVGENRAAPSVEELRRL